MKTAHTFPLTCSTGIYRRIILLSVPLILCSFLFAACGQATPASTDNGQQTIVASTNNDQQATPASTDNGQQSTPTTTNNDQQATPVSTDNGQQSTPATTNNGIGNIVHNFKCTSGISQGVKVPLYPGALHITFLQATDTANFVQDEITIQADSNSSNTFTWALRSTGEQETATITDPTTGAYYFGVSVLGFTQTLSMDPETGQMQQATFWVAEVCDQWATDGAPAY